jgi:hypothetical protein
MIDTITINPAGHIQVREIRDGVYHRYCLAPGDDLTGQPDEIIEAAEKAWTPENIAAYQAVMDEALAPVTAAEKAAQDKESLIRAKMRTMAEAELIAEGMLTADGKLMEEGAVK